MWVFCQPTLALDEGFLNQLHCYKKILLGDSGGVKSTPPKFVSASNFRVWPYLATGSVFVCLDCQKRYATARVASTIECISSQFSTCKIKVWFLLSLFLGCQQSPSYFILMWPFLWCWFITDISWVCPNFAFLDGIGLQPMYMAFFHPYCLFKGRICKCSHVLRFWRLGLQHVNWGERWGHNLATSNEGFWDEITLDLDGPWRMEAEQQFLAAVVQGTPRTNRSWRRQEGVCLVFRGIMALPLHWLQTSLLQNCDKIKNLAK